MFCFFSHSVICFTRIHTSQKKKKFYHNFMATLSMSTKTFIDQVLVSAFVCFRKSWFCNVSSLLVAYIDFSGLIELFLSHSLLVSCWVKYSLQCSAQSLNNSLCAKPTMCQVHKTICAVMCHANRWRMAPG